MLPAPFKDVLLYPYLCWCHKGFMGPKGAFAPFAPFLAQELHRPNPYSTQSPNLGSVGRLLTLKSAELHQLHLTLYLHHPLMGHWCNKLTAPLQTVTAVQISAKEGFGLGGSVNTQTSCYVIARYAIWARGPSTTMYTDTEIYKSGYVHTVYYTAWYTKKPRTACTMESVFVCNVSF